MRSSIMPVISLVFVVGLLWFIFPPPSQAEIPQVISYQGKVTDTGGTPVPDGTYDMRFSIYDVATGGTSLWYSGTVNVQVADGIFSVLLGQSPQPAVNLPFDEDYWLSTWIEGNTQTPRQRLASTGYAYMASGLVPGTEVSGSVASPPDAAIKGTNTATSSNTYGLYGQVASTDGSGVYGQSTATTGTTKGVYGVSASTSGRGVVGHATATTGFTAGVVGTTNSTTGNGVYGEAYTASGGGIGVYGVSFSPDGRGVLGTIAATTGTNYGVYGTNQSPSGYGVYGDATSSSGTNYGVSGRTYSASGYGVYGYASATTGTNYGVYGITSSPSGYAGYFQGDAKVTGDLTVDGVLTASGVGDITAVNAGTGLDGGGSAGDVTLEAAVPFVLIGSHAGNIITGLNADTTGAGVGGLGRLGIRGEGEYAGGKFEDNTSFTIAYVGHSTYKVSGNGTCNFVQNHPYDGDLVVAYSAIEGNEVATYTRGTACLNNGKARVRLDETFEWVTNPDIGLTAHLTPRGDCNGLYVASLSTTAVEVHERGGGTSDVAFDYVIYGLRIGFEEVSIVQEKDRESYIPSMEDHRNLFARRPDLRRYNSLERFKNMRAAIGIVDPLDLSASQMLRDSIEEYDVSIHGPVGEDVGRELGHLMLADPIPPTSLKATMTREVENQAAAETDSYLYPELREKELRDHEN